MVIMFIREDFYDLKQSAEVLQVSTATVRRRLKKGELQGIKHDVGFGEQFFLNKDQFSVAEHIIQVVDVHKTYDLKEFALSLNVLLDERDADLKKDMRLIKEVVAEQLISAVESMDKMTEELGTVKEQNALLIEQNKLLMDQLANKEEPKGLSKLFKRK